MDQQEEELSFPNMEPGGMPLFLLSVCLPERGICCSVQEGGKERTLRAARMPGTSWSMSAAVASGSTATSSFRTWKVPALVFTDLSRSCLEAARKMAGTSARNCTTGLAEGPPSLKAMPTCMEPSCPSL